jgi:hypothetical protein
MATNSHNHHRHTGKSTDTRRPAATKPLIIERFAGQAMKAGIRRHDAGSKTGFHFVVNLVLLGAAFGRSRVSNHNLNFRRLPVNPGQLDNDFSITRILSFKPYDVTNLVVHDDRYLKIVQRTAGGIVNQSQWHIFCNFQGIVEVFDGTVAGAAPVVSGIGGTSLKEQHNG